MPGPDPASSKFCTAHTLGLSSQQPDEVSLISTTNYDAPASRSSLLSFLSAAEPLVSVYRQPLILFFCAIFSLLTTSWAHADPPQSAQDHLNDARSLYNAGHWKDAAQAFEKAYNLATNDSEIRAATALEWSSLLWEQGHYPRAETLVTEAIELAKALRLDHATGQLLLTLGHIEASKGDLSAAENTLNICVQLTEEADDHIFRALCRLNRRMVRTLRGKNPGPTTEFDADIAILRDNDAPLSVGTSLEKTAEFYRDANDLDRAKTLLDQAQRIYQDTGSVPAITRNRLRQAQLLHRAGEFTKAAPLLPKLLEQFETMDNHPLVIQTIALQAEQALHDQNKQHALSLYQRALHIALRVDNPQLTGRLELAICELSIASSLQHCQRAADIFRAADMRFLHIRALTEMARTHQRASNLEEARSAYRSAIDTLETTTANHGMHLTTRTLQLANLCQVEIRLKATGALATCQSALTDFSSISAAEQTQYALLRATTTFAAGRAAISEGQRTTALNHLQDAARQYLDLNEPKPLLAAEVLLHLGHLQNRLKAHQDEAPATFERALLLLPLPPTSEMDDADSANLPTLRISLLTQLAQRYLADQSWQKASASLQRLKDEALSINDHSSTAWAYLGLARALLHTERRDDAIEALRKGLTYAEIAQDDALIRQFKENFERFNAH